MVGTEVQDYRRACRDTVSGFRGVTVVGVMGNEWGSILFGYDWMVMMEIQLLPEIVGFGPLIIS